MNPQTTETVIRAGNPVPTLDDPPSGAIEADGRLGLGAEADQILVPGQQMDVKPCLERSGGRQDLVVEALHSDRGARHLCPTLRYMNMGPRTEIYGSDVSGR